MVLESGRADENRSQVLEPTSLPKLKNQAPKVSRYASKDGGDAKGASAKDPSDYGCALSTNRHAYGVHGEGGGNLGLALGHTERMDWDRVEVRLCY